MGKVAAYLQQHIWGEVSTRPQVLDTLSRDGSLLQIRPDLAVYPRTTNDVRKVARFAWQLAEKGHIMPITVRGGGTDQTGAAIGKGISLVTTRHLNRIFELDAKQKLIRVQPGVGLANLKDALLLHGLGIPSVITDEPIGTIGGAIASGAMTLGSSKSGDALDAIDKLEVVLANGDVIQTGRISKRELNRRKGAQGFEGDIYRGIDALIEDNQDTLDMIADNELQAAGYPGIVDVKRSDGSFDLAPLFTGSQGTLGVIVEMIVKAEFVSASRSVSVMCFTDPGLARDTIDRIENFDPASIEYYDAYFFEDAAKRGSVYDFYERARQLGELKSVVVVEFNDFSAKKRRNGQKKIAKMLAKANDIALVQADASDAEDLLALRDVRRFYQMPEANDAAVPPLMEGFYIPHDRMDDFCKSLAELENHLKVGLPLYGWPLQDIYFTSPMLHLSKVSDRQKVFKTLDELEKLISSFAGNMVAFGGEGRIKAKFAHRNLSDAEKELYAGIKKVFDPYNMLNPGVKQPGDLRDLVDKLTHDYMPPMA